MGIGLAVGAIASGIGAESTFALTGITLGFSFQAAAISFALGGLQSLLTPKPKNNLGGTNIKNSGITQNVRQPISVRRGLYGEARIGGALTFIETTSNDQDLHMVLTLVDHEIESIDEVWFDDISIPLDAIDGSGNVTSGPYSGQVRLKFHLGTAAQTADSDLVAETSVDSNFRGRGVAYLYATLTYDRDVFPSKIPVMTVFAKGKKIFDPRDSMTRWSPNPAMFINDFLTEDLDAFVPGMGVDSGAVDTTAFTAAANACEEYVTVTNLDDTMESADNSTDIITLTGVNSRLQFQFGDLVQVIDDGGGLPGGLAVSTDYYVMPYQRRDTPRIKLASSLANALAGTAVTISSDGDGTIRKISEPRYFGGGTIETSEIPKQTIEDILSAFAGNLVPIGGSWFINAGAYATPVFTFDESHLISNVVVRPQVSRRDRFNLVKGVYVAPINDGEPSDYPSVTNSTYVTQDNGRTIPVDHDLPFTQRPHTAMRLAKIKLEKHRQMIFIEAEFNLHAMQVQPGDNVMIDNTRLGWSGKVFEVVRWELAERKVNKASVFYVKMSLQETASTVYDWNNGEETAVDPAPNTNLPDPLTVAPPTGLAVQPVEIRTADGDLTYEFDISWTPSADIFVVNGGYYEVQFKQSTDADWKRSYRAEDDDDTVTVKQVNPGTNYDCRVRAVNSLGVRSSYQSLFGFNVSSPSGATIKIDYGAITGSVVDSFDYGAITGSEDTTEDFGSIT